MFPPWDPALGPHMAALSHQQPAAIDNERPGRSKTPDTEDDVIDLLDDSEALELIEFDPTVETTNTWDPMQAMLSFLEKHFNRCLTDDERASILSNFPKLSTPVLQVPRLDDDIKEQLKRRERTLIMVRNEFFSSCKTHSWMCLGPSCAYGQPSN